MMFMSKIKCCHKIRMNLYICRQDVLSLFDVMKITKELNHTFYTFPENISFAFIKTLINYPECNI